MALVSNVRCHQSVRSDGWLTVVHHPADTRQCVVYIALSKQDSGYRFAQNVFATRSAQQLPIDCFLLKGTLQANELNSVYPSYEKERIKKLEQAISAILKRTHKGSEVRVFTNELNEFNNVMWHIERLQISLEQQMSGIKRQFLGAELSPIATYYLALLAVHLDDVRAATSKNAVRLEAVKNALAFVKAEEAEIANENSTRLNKIVSFLGTFIAIDQVIEKDLVKAWWEQTFRYPLSDSGAFSVRLIAAAFLAWLIPLGFVRLMRWWHERKQ